MLFTNYVSCHIKRRTKPLYQTEISAYTILHDSRTNRQHFLHKYFAHPLKMRDKLPFCKTEISARCDIFRYVTYQGDHLKEAPKLVLSPVRSLWSR